jgi:hypothetical protein
MNVINQINVANHGVYPFSDRLKKRYGFVDYYDINSPCFFWGGLGEIKKINDHRGLKIIKFITPSDCETLNDLENSDNLFIINDPLLKPIKNYKFADIEFEYQDYSIFKPKVLGDKIYSYMRDPIEFQKNIILEIQKKINYEIIFGGEVSNAKYYDTLENLKRNYYDKCFLSLNLSGKHGYTTVRELGLMGIKTVMRSPYKFPSIIGLKNYSIEGSQVKIDIDEIVDIINDESKKIGFIQNEINPHNVKNEWIKTDFWYEKKYEQYSR